MVRKFNGSQFIPTRTKVAVIEGMNFELPNHSGIKKFVKETKTIFKNSVITVTSAYTALNTDHIILCDTTSAGFTVTLPPLLEVGFILHIKKIDGTGNAVTIDADGTQTIDGELTKLLNTQYDNAMVVFDGSNWHII